MYINIYDFFQQKLISYLKNINISLHKYKLFDINVKIIIFDFCGKIKNYYKIFRKENIHIYVAYDCFENEIYPLIDKYDLIYIFVDVEYLKNFPSLYQKSILFIIFDGPKFLYIKTANDLE